jgi:hypothetical protein
MIQIQRPDGDLSGNLYGRDLFGIRSRGEEQALAFQQMSAHPFGY